MAWPTNKEGHGWCLRCCMTTHCRDHREALAAYRHQKEEQGKTESMAWKRCRSTRWQGGHSLSAMMHACPSVDSKLLKTLLRETRMVTAILHSRSAIQVVHVVVAALKRAGLTAMAVSLESTPPLGTQQHQHFQYHHQPEKSTSQRKREHLRHIPHHNQAFYLKPHSMQRTS